MKEAIQSPLVAKLQTTEKAISTLNTLITDIGTSRLTVGAGTRLNLEPLSGIEFAKTAIEVGKVRGKITAKSLPFLENQKQELTQAVAVEVKERDELRTQLTQLKKQGLLSQEEFDKAFSQSSIRSADQTSFKAASSREDIKPQESEKQKRYAFVLWTLASRVRTLRYIIDSPQLDINEIMALVRPRAFANSEDHKVFAARTIRKTLDMLFIRDQRGLLTSQEKSLSGQLVSFMDETGFETLSELKHWIIAKFELTEEQKKDLGFEDINSEIIPLSLEEAYSVAMRFHQNYDLLRDRGLVTITDDMMSAFQNQAKESEMESYAEDQLNEFFASGIQKIQKIIHSGKLEEVWDESEPLIMDLISCFCVRDGSKFNTVIAEIQEKYLPTIPVVTETEPPKPPKNRARKFKPASPDENKIDLAQPKKSSQEKMKGEITEEVSVLVDEIYAHVEAGELPGDTLMNSNQINRVIQRLKQSDVEIILGNGHVRPTEVKNRVEYFSISDVVTMLVYRDRKSGLPKKYQRFLEQAVQEQITLKINQISSSK